MITYTEDALIQFQTLVREITGADLNQTDAAVELDDIRERYSRDGEARARVAAFDALVEAAGAANPTQQYLNGAVRDALGAGRLGL